MSNEQRQQNKRKIIGLTGAFGSGTSFIADNFFATKETDDTKNAKQTNKLSLNFKKFSLSEILKEEFKTNNSRIHKNRRELQDFGNKIREDKPYYLAEEVDKLINADENKTFDIVIDSFRNPAEIKYFRDKYPEFILIGIFADYEVRWKRVQNTYKNRDEFDKDDFKDKGSNEPENGQRISDCFFEADLILSNNEYINPEGGNDKFFEMLSKINGYLQALDDPIHSNPTAKEIAMAEAYASGRRSRCLKRKVGSLITDKYNRIISSGFNGVPYGLKECKSLKGACYRDTKREEIAQKFCNDLSLEGQKDSALNVVRKNIKLLELCRALHAEESAILNLVGNGIDLEDTTMYVTTFPCNLCANKIVQTHIKRVIYFEPYPVEEAKTIFKQANVITEPFEGVTFRAFFKFFQYQA